MGHHPHGLRTWGIKPEVTQCLCSSLSPLWGRLLSPSTHLIAARFAFPQFVPRCFLASLSHALSCRGVPWCLCGSHVASCRLVLSSDGASSFLSATFPSWCFTGAASHALPDARHPGSEPELRVKSCSPAPQAVLPDLCPTPPITGGILGILLHVVPVLSLQSGGSAPLQVLIGVSY